MLYEPSLHAKLLGIISKKEIQIEMSISIEIFNGQEVRILDPVQTGASPDFEVAIPILVRGSAEGEKTVYHDTIWHEINTGVTIAGPDDVSAAVDDDVYSLLATSYISGTPKSNNTGTISSNSDIEIL